MSEPLPKDLAEALKTSPPQPIEETIDSRFVSPIRVEELKWVGRSTDDKADLYEDSTGREFYGEIEKNPADQMLVAKMLKGIMPVADVVTSNFDGKLRFFSQRMPFRQSEYSGDDELVEAKADIYLLDYIFGDHDKILSMGQNFSKIGNSYFLYDFENSRNFWNESRLSDMPDLYRRNISEKSALEKAFLRQKTQALKERFGGEEGLQFLTQIVDSIQKTGIKESDILQTHTGVIEEGQIERFRDELMKRVQFIEDFVKN